MNGNWTRLTGTGVAAALVVALVSWTGASLAQTTGESAPSAAVPAAPERISGTVTAIDSKSGTVTLRGDDGQTHQFRGDAETVKNLKVGEKIDLSRRATR